MELTHASVFSGIGGPEVASAMLGWVNLFHCEINPFGRKVLQYWFPKSISYEDIKKTDFTEWRGRIDVLTGGFPCQPFSVAGKRKGYEDDRYLWQEMHRCIKEIQPTWFVCENVAGILTMVEQGEVSQVASEAALFGEVDPIPRFRHRATFTIERICTDVESEGYEVQPVLIPACAVGAPHQRSRVFIIGRRIVEESDSHRGCELHEHVESELADGAKPVSNGEQRNVTDTSNIGAGEREQAEREECGRSSLSELRERYCASLSEDGGSCGQRWRNFPSVSPVHRRNDGIPFDVDDLTLPFEKWRTESLKAYGNAIVPQVMYEIFRGIEETYDIKE